MSAVFWVWVAVAATMLVAEVAQPTSLYWPWVPGAIVAAVLEAYGSGPWPQWGAFVLIPAAIIISTARIRTSRARGSGHDADSDEPHHSQD